MGADAGFSLAKFEMIRLCNHNFRSWKSAKSGKFLNRYIALTTKIDDEVVVFELTINLSFTTTY